MADIIWKDATGKPIVYKDVNQIEVPSTDGGVVIYTEGSGGGGIIEVNEFPTENVQNEVIYKKSFKTDTEMYLVNSMGTSSLKDISNVTYYEVEDLPNEMIESDLENGIFNIYIVNGIGYVSSNFGDGAMTLTMGDVCEVENKGYIENINNAIEDGVYTVKGKETFLYGVNGETYNYIDNHWIDYYEQVNGIFNKTIINLNLPKVKTIPPYLFFQCLTIKTANLPNVTVIEADAFLNCLFLQSINISNISEIKNDAFSMCTNLLAVIIQQTDSVCVIGTRVFDGSPIESGTGYIYVPNVEDYKSATNWSKYASQIKPLSELPQEYKYLYDIEV